MINKKLQQVQIVAFAACVALSSATSRAEPLQRVEKTADQVELTFPSGRLELIPLADSTIRVRFWDGKMTPFPSFVLLSDLPKPQFTVEESNKEIVVATKKIRAAVDRSDGTIRFSDASGRVFLSEKPGQRLLRPAKVGNEATYVVEQGFESPADERLFGLGQFQDGLWNWRGLPIELRQLNTQIAVPMLISSKGYGLLWDNASRTDFNLPGDEIALVVENPSDPSKTAGPAATEQLSDSKSAKPKITPIHTGTFTPDTDGDYVFCIRDADRRDEITILVDGRQIAGVKNMWTPRAVVGKIALSAGKPCTVTVRGGGDKAKLFVRHVADSTTFRSDCGEAIDYTVFYGPRIDDIIAEYRAVTGPAPLWPLWAYGFWQCRERYSSQQQILDTAAEFRRRNIPVDLIVQDWRYWGPHGWGSYQWDEAQYPAPADMLKALREMHVKFMISVWCNPSGEAGKELNEKKLMTGGWIDLFSEQGRNLRWKYLDQAFFSIGTDGWWGDATEPGDPGTDLLGKKISLGAGDRFTNAYPLFASQSIYDGQRASGPDKRVCILTRSAFPGQQRYAAAAWSGDINGDWETFRRQIPAGLNFSLTGQPYWTTDCGGFFRPPGQYTSPDFNELLARWFQWSTFCPILRAHGYGTRTEMWHWLPETQKVMLAYDRLRYRMLPYNYSVAWQVTSKGYTIMRPLGMDFPDDARAWGIADEYMFGPAFLVTPVTQPGATTREVYLPAGSDWVDFWSGERHAGGKAISTGAPLETLPLFVRSGSIVPLGPDLQYTSEKPADPLELRIYPGADGSFTLYEDEGDSYRYEKGEFATIKFTWNDTNQTLEIGKRQGAFPGMLEKRRFRIVRVEPDHGVGIEPSAKAAEIFYEGKEATVKFDKSPSEHL